MTNDEQNKLRKLRRRARKNDAIIRKIKNEGYLVIDMHTGGVISGKSILPLSLDEVEDYIKYFESLKKSDSDTDF